MSSLDDLAKHVPVIPQQYDEPVLLRRRATLIKQSQKAVLQLNIIDINGVNIDLTGTGIPDINLPTNSSSGDEGNNTYMKARFTEASNNGSGFCDSDVFLVDTSEGLINTAIPVNVAIAAGVYLAEIGIFNSEDQLVHSTSCYVWVDASGWGNMGSGSRGIPAMDAIRISLRDSDPVESVLFDEYSYSLADICLAAVRTVDFWNDQPPPIRIALFNTTTFPFRDIMMKGIHLFLFQQAEEWYRRNRLDHNAGGVNIDDLHKAPEYNAAWKERLQEFKELVKHRKISINAGQAYSTLGSGYNNYRGGAFSGGQGLL